MAETDKTWGSNLDDAAKQYLVRDGGDVFPNLLSMNIRRRPERGSVWRIAPPLTVSHDAIDRAVGILNAALAESLDEIASGAA